MKDIFIDPTATVKIALKKLDAAASKVLLVVKENHILIGAISDGDIRRHLLNNGSLDDLITSVYNQDPISIQHNDQEVVKKTLLENKIDLVPVTDDKGKVIEIYSWEDVFFRKPEKKQGSAILDLPVVVMAGGKGTRMQPFTTVLPKPLIPIGDKTILETLIDNFREYGIDKFYFTLNYRGEMIKAYFDSIQIDYYIEYVWEKEFNGTAGSLSLIPEIKNTFMVSNCDIIVRADYADIYNFHRSSDAALTVISSIQHHTIPYGVIEYAEGGVVKDITEKPEYSFPINTGVYILEPKVIEFIPKNTIFHMTDLIKALIKNGNKVVTYFVNENDYIDIGQWEEYREALRRLKL